MERNRTPKTDARRTPATVSWLAWFVLALTVLVSSCQAFPLPEMPIGFSDPAIWLSEAPGLAGTAGPA
ncbi:MAG: hypothetical protein ACFBWO_11620 [Paracoccaceae bacterium]